MPESGSSKPTPNSAVSRAASGKPAAPYRGAYRSTKRQSHHEDAHSEVPDASDTSTGGREDALIFRGPPVLIETQAALEALLVRLKTAGSFAYDSEFIGEATYTPKLCLVQIATTTEVALVDPLAKGLDLTAFWNLLCDASVEKIVHAGQQDVEPVVRLTGGTPKNIFDTQLAGGFVSLTYPVALSKLVAELIGAKLAKSMTFTQWDARPLTPTQLKYAADDVRYLPKLKAILQGWLDEAGHSARAREEFDALCEPTQYIFNPNTYIHRVRGSGSLTPSQLRVLRELVVWRDGAARAADVPARVYLKDEVLVDLSRSPIKSVDRLSKVRGLPRPVEQEHGSAIVAATLKGLSADPVPGIAEDKNEEPTPSFKFKADAIWSAAQSLCHAQGIDPMLAASRGDIGKLVYAAVSNKPLPEDLAVLTGWRRELLGEPLLEMIRDSKSLSITWQGGVPRKS